MANRIKISTTDVLLIGGGLLAFTAVKRILIAAGIAAGQGTQAASQLITDPNSYFKPSYYKRTGGSLIRRADAERYARQIHSAFGIFQDDFNAIIAVFSRMPSKAAISFLADVFSQIYKEDLLTFLTNGGGLLPWDGLSDNQLKQLLALTNKLPNR
jgi:hypothetical protein